MCIILTEVRAHRSKRTMLKSIAVRTLRTYRIINSLCTDVVLLYPFVWYGTEANGEDLVAPTGEAAVYSAEIITS